MGATKPIEERKTTHVTFNATDEIRDLFDRASKTAGYGSRTHWMVAVLTREARKILKGIA